MPWLLFVSQAAIDAWADQGKVEFHGHVIALADGDGEHRYELVPAVRFLGVVGADSDPNGLVAKVKSEERVRALGGELLGDSVVLGDVAYEVQAGFIAEGVDAADSSDVPPAGAPRGQRDRRSEAGVLARFVLKNLA
jgi:hypothetical protein